MSKTELKKIISAAFVVLLLLPLSVFGAAGEAGEDQPGGDPASIIIERFLQATQNHENALRGASMEVEIDANVPKLKEQGRLRALREISKVGQVTYHVLFFQGDNTVKNQVIARYLQAEQQGQGDQSLAITPENYKFKYKGLKTKEDGQQQVHVFQLSPRKKRVGLFKGEMWLDAETYLPVLQKGRLVKNPSIFFKKVDFERVFAIKDGAAIPQTMTSTIDVRLIGKVELNINYSHFAQNSNTQTAVGSSEPAPLPVAVAK